MMNALMIIGGIAFLLVLYFISVYNSLIAKRNQVENSFGGIDVQLKKRCDLIPNLIKVAGKYMTHEKEVLTNLTALRTQATSGTLSTEERIELDQKMSSAMKSIMISVENYPDLKANQSVDMLQRSLNEVESQISASRRFYNSTVTSYNTAIETFPNNIVAGMAGCQRKTVFQATVAERENVDVNDYM
ncbi:LemA family protein [Flammeovirga aprica]|uniref:LemA family protein n=1 Tax=Flammeovirga aprica JL-4 TaxID=694437 RepID=A0A7X9XCV6_9BACT|nr:LemA family protein [Flammeovirga aprica]NME72236.1 LemA family protein [Flammeovirga aprica JL-4]